MLPSHMQLEQVGPQLGSKRGTVDQRAELLQLEGGMRREKESEDCPSWGKQICEGRQKGLLLLVCFSVSLLVSPSVARPIPVLETVGTESSCCLTHQIHCPCHFLCFSSFWCNTCYKMLKDVRQGYLGRHGGKKLCSAQLDTCPRCACTCFCRSLHIFGTSSAPVSDDIHLSYSHPRKYSLCDL